MSDKIKIDKDVPIPKRIPPVRNRYPVLNAMGIGDSFLRPIDERRLVISAINNLRSRSKRRFTTQTSQDNTTVRVWRIK